MSKALIFFSIFFFALLVESRPSSNVDVACAGCDAKEIISRPKRHIDFFLDSLSNLLCNVRQNNRGIGHGCASRRGPTNIYYIGNGQGNRNIININRRRGY